MGRKWLDCIPLNSLEYSDQAEFAGESLYRKERVRPHQELIIHGGRHAEGVIRNSACVGKQEHFANSK